MSPMAIVLMYCTAMAIVFYFDMSPMAIVFYFDVSHGYYILL